MSTQISSETLEQNSERIVTVVIICERCGSNSKEIVLPNVERILVSNERHLCPVCSQIEARNCSNRIEGELTSLNSNLKEIFEKYESDSGAIRDAAFDELAEYAAGVEMLKTVKLVLSGGNPDSWLEVTHNDENIIQKVVFVFEDWFDRAEVKVQPGKLGSLPSL